MLRTSRGGRQGESVENVNSSEFLGRAGGGGAVVDALDRLGIGEIGRVQNMLELAAVPVAIRGRVVLERVESAIGVDPWREALVGGDDGEVVKNLVAKIVTARCPILMILRTAKRVCGV